MPPAVAINWRRRASGFSGEGAGWAGSTQGTQLAPLRQPWPRTTLGSATPAFRPERRRAGRPDSSPPLLTNRVLRGDATRPRLQKQGSESGGAVCLEGGGEGRLGDISRRWEREGQIRACLKLAQQRAGV